MNQEKDSAAFEQALVEMFRTLGHDAPDKQVRKLWWNLMQDMTIDAFLAACGKYLATETRLPVPAAIRNLAGANKSAFPTPEQAWNLLPKSDDEGGWLCQEMATAMGACADSLAAGDRIGARMAFLEVYRTEIQGKAGKPSWWLSEPAGMLPEQRAQWKADMLLTKPDRRPDLLPGAEEAVAAISGPKRTSNGLVPVLGGSDGRR